MKTSAESFFDYSSYGFIIPLKVEGMEIFACINPSETTGENAVDTSPYYVYLMHPKKGTCSFKIEHNVKGQSFSSNAPAFLDKKLISEIDIEVGERKNNLLNE
jgi:hypothetical protein